MRRIFSRTGGSPRRTGRTIRVAPPATTRGIVARARSGYPAISGAPIILLLLLALSLTACGDGGGAQSAGSSADYAPRDGDVAAAPGESAEGAAASAGVASSSAAPEIGGGAEGGVRAALPDFDGEKIVKTAELAVRADDVRESASRAQEVAVRFGGSVTSSRIDGGESVSADLVLSVPSGEFEAALDELRDLGDVTTDTVGGEDVTEEFVDLRSRERNLLRAEESLLRLYDEAESVDDALSIERELAGLREQIELVQGRVQFLEDRTSTSRISLGIQAVPKPAEPRLAWEPARAVSNAWNASLSFLGTVAGAALSVVVFGWWLAPVLVAAALWWRRRARASSLADGP